MFKCQVLTEHLHAFSVLTLTITLGNSLCVPILQMRKFRHRLTLLSKYEIINWKVGGKMKKIGNLKTPNKIENTPSNLLVINKYKWVIFIDLLHGKRKFGYWLLIREIFKQKRQRKVENKGWKKTHN